jgi:hypothetical protein
LFGFFSSPIFSGLLRGNLLRHEKKNANCCATFQKGFFFIAKPRLRSLKKKQKSKAVTLNTIKNKAKSMQRSAAAKKNNVKAQVKLSSSNLSRVAIE